MASLNNFTYLKDCDNPIALCDFKTWELVQNSLKSKEISSFTTFCIIQSQSCLIARFWSIWTAFLQIS